MEVKSSPRCCTGNMKYFKTRLMAHSPVRFCSRFLPVKGSFFSSLSPGAVHEGDVGSKHSLQDFKVTFNQQVNSLPLHHKLSAAYYPQTHNDQSGVVSCLIGTRVTCAFIRVELIKILSRDTSHQWIQDQNLQNLAVVSSISVLTC